MNYSIIIPIFNEESSIEQLLKELRKFSFDNEIVIINDGSSDQSDKILTNCNFITYKKLKKNYGKGFAISTGISISKYNKIIITDGDLELKTRDLKKFMFLNKDKNIRFLLGTRYRKINIYESKWTIGNYLLTKLFNFKYKCDITDALCCSKAFYKKDIQRKGIKSLGFDIDVEITSILISTQPLFKEVPINYNRRSFKEGKKIRIIDGLFILKRILFN